MSKRSLHGGGIFSIAEKVLLPAMFITAGLLIVGYVAATAIIEDQFRPVLSFALSVGASFVFLGSLVNSRYRWFAVWTVVGLIGHAASLQMIDAGRRIHFQHYRSIGEIASVAPFVLPIVGVQLVAITAGLIMRRRELVHAIKRVGVLRIALLLIFLASCSAAVTPEPMKYASSLFLGTLVQLLALSGVFLAVTAIPKDVLGDLNERFAWLLGSSETENNSGPRLDKFVLVLALAVTVLTALLSYFVYQAHPHVPDETQYLFQAKYIAAGQLTVMPPLVPEAFEMYMVPYLDERWYSIFPPAFPVVLAVGLKLGAFWMVNPILAGICVLLSYLLVQTLYSTYMARVTVVLLISSPWFIFMGMNLMSHMFTLTCALGAGVLLLRGLRARSIFPAAAAGGLVGIVSLARPLSFSKFTGLKTHAD